MALYYDYRPSQIKYDNRSYFNKNIRSLSERQVRWVQEYLASNKSVSFSNIGATDRYQALINALAQHENFRELVDESYSKMLHSLIPEVHFKWVSDSLRAQIFALHILSSEYGYNFDQNSHDLMNELYYFFDDKNNTTYIDNKIILLNNIKKRWHVVFEKDNYSKWLAENNKEQIEWTRDYLRKDGRYNYLGRDTSLHEEIRSHILAALDIVDYPINDKEIENYVQSDRKERIIDKMKRAWSQQKYRDAGKTKKPYHLPLTKKTKARLEKMAQVQGLSETATLDILINRFYELDYVDVDGKDLY